MNPRLAELYNRHAASSFDKQLSLNDVVAGRDWRFDMTSGLLSFGEQLRWHAQLLGTESEASRTWLWAWANEGSAIPGDLLRSASFLRAMGDLLHLPELTEPQLPLGEVDGHYLATLASGICQAGAYYRAPYAGGSLFLLIVDDRFERRIDQPLARIPAVFPLALQHLPVSNHRTAWAGYLRFYGLEGVDTGSTVRVERDGETVLTASFDEQDRLVHLEGIVSPPEPPPEPGAVPVAATTQGAYAGANKPVVAFGPETPGWGSWDWVGAEVQAELARDYQTVSFRGQDLPDCDVLVVVKHPLPEEVVERAARRAAVIYCPVDAYGSNAEIEADGAMLSRCARIVIHCERLRRYFAPYAPVEYMDHHVNFAVPPRRQHPSEGPILWVGVRTNLPPLVEWANAHPLPCELCVLTNPETPGQVPLATDLGFRPGVRVRVEEWSRERHQELAMRSRAALDVKGSDFRALHKPAAKAIDFLASGLPLAMNTDSSPVEHLARLGFEVAAPLDTERWLSREYWDETRRFGAALRELLSRERIGRRYKRLIDEVLAERR